ncbi:MAG: AAA family ATPase [Saprospiraceae bacterium]|nr:AAA family ATPase [Saprospiraceae bacterium]
MKYWIEKTLVNGRQDRLEGDRALGKALWSPQKDKRGADIYKNMRVVKSGDVIIHLIDNLKIVAVSIARTNVIESIGIPGTEWDGPAYLIQLENFEKLLPELSRDLILNPKNKILLDEINNESEVFYNNKLELRQGAYLTPCPLKLLTLINNVYKSISNNNLPHVISSDLLDVNINKNAEFNFNNLKNSIKNSGLSYSDILFTRFTASLLTKPFVILTGLSGSGKTKLAQAFVQWICQDESQYRIIPVGADWTNREPLLGYPNALKPEEYVKPDSGVLDLIIQANLQPDLPHFLILDEMNLSHVERYFADFLSVMESNEEIPLYTGNIENGVPARLKVASNLFIIGTVNIDETTNMFSPKVLDRANTIEFRVTQVEMANFLRNIKDINMDALSGKGAGMAKSFLEMAVSKDFTTTDIDEINTALVQFFSELKKTGAEFGYRSATEILRLIHQLTVLDNTLTTNQKIDIAIMQKLLPKLHGSRRKLSPVLEKLGAFCVTDKIKVITDVFGKDDFDFENSPEVLYRLSLEKIARMYKGAIDNGFASFAEA